MGKKYILDLDGRGTQRFYMGGGQYLTVEDGVEFEEGHLLLVKFPSYFREKKDLVQPQVELLLEEPLESAEVEVSEDQEAKNIELVDNVIDSSEDQEVKEDVPALTSKEIFLENINVLKTKKDLEAYVKEILDYDLDKRQSLAKMRDEAIEAYEGE